MPSMQAAGKKYKAGKSAYNIAERTSRGACVPSPLLPSPALPCSAWPTPAHPTRIVFALSFSPSVDDEDEEDEDSAVPRLANVPSDKLAAEVQGELAAARALASQRAAHVFPVWSRSPAPAEPMPLEIAQRTQPDGGVKYRHKDEL